MDAITLLKQDHKTVEKLFKQFEKAKQPAQQRKLARQVVKELSVHAAIEEMVFHPAVRERVPKAEDTVLEALEEHYIVKWVLSELEDMKPDHERFKAKMTVMIESVRHHVEEEESEMFPKLQEELGTTKLTDLGKKLADAKQKALRKETGGSIVEGDLASLTKDQLYEEAKKADIEGRSDMTKEELVKALAQQ